MVKVMRQITKARLIDSLFTKNLVPRQLERHHKHIVLLVGLNKRSRRYLAAADTYRSSGVKILGVIDNNEGETIEINYLMCEDYLERLNIPELGTIDDLRNILEENIIDEVHITLPIRSSYEEIAKVIEICEIAGVPTSLADPFDHSSLKLGTSRDMYGYNELNYSCALRTPMQRFLKRSMDIIGSFFALILLFVPMILIAIAIKLTSRGPIFFTQSRLGLNHRTFRMIKFRTMHKNAEQSRKELDKQNEADGPVFNIKRDPRNTPIGYFLRKFSIDEIPQFINVLRGQMSLVGPRPPIASEVKQYDWWQRRRLSTKPGLTCYWQTEKRCEITFEEWMRLDLKYIDDWSLMLDIKLMLKTIPVLIFGR